MLGHLVSQTKTLNCEGWQQMIKPSFLPPGDLESNIWESKSRNDVLLDDRGMTGGTVLLIV